VDFYPYAYENLGKKKKQELLLDTRLRLREALEDNEEGFVYSFWPDVITLKEIGDPHDIGTYFNLWEVDERFTAKVAVCVLFHTVTTRTASWYLYTDFNITRALYTIL